MAEVLGRIIVIKKNGEDGSILPMLENLCTVGRDPDCDIRIKLPTVSSKHCKLEIVGGKVVFTNLSGTNPPLVNNIAIEDKTFLNDEDVFTVTTRSFRWEICKSKENDAKVTKTEQENRSGNKSTKKRLMRSSSNKSLTIISTPVMVKTPKVILKRTSARMSSGIMKTPTSSKKSNEITFVDQNDNDENVEKIISSPDRKKTAALRSIHAAQLKSKNSPESSKSKKNENSLQLSPSIESPGSSEKQKTPGKPESGDSSFDFSSHKTPSVPTEMFVSPLQTPSSRKRSSTSVPQEQGDNPEKDGTIDGEDGHLESNKCTKLHENISGTPSRKTSYMTRRRSSPKADYTNVAGVKRLMAKSPVADYNDISGVDMLMASPESQVTSNDNKEEKEKKSTTKRKLSSLKSEESLEEGEGEVDKKDATFTKRRSSLKNDYSNISGVNILMQSPKVVDPEATTTPKSAASKRKSGELNSASAKYEKHGTPGREAQVVLARISPQIIEQYSPKSQSEQMKSFPSSGVAVKKKSVLAESTVINQSPLPSDNRESNLSIDKCIDKYRSRKSQEINLTPLKMSPKRLVLSLTDAPSVEKSSRVSTPSTFNKSASLHEQKYSKTPEISPSKQRKETSSTDYEPEHEKTETTLKVTPTPVKEAEKTPRSASLEMAKSRKSTPGSGPVLIRTLRSRTVSSVKKRKSFEAKVKRVTARKVKKIEMEKLPGLQSEEQIANEEAVMEQDENAGVEVTTNKADVVSTKSAVKARQTRRKNLAEIDIAQLQEKLEVEDTGSNMTDRIDEDDNVSDTSSIATTRRKRNVKSKVDVVETSPVKKTVRRARKVTGTPSTVKKNGRGTKLEMVESSNEDEQSDTEPVVETLSVRKTRLRKGKSPKMSTSPVTNVKKSASKAKASRPRSSSFSPGIRITRSRKQSAAKH